MTASYCKCKPHPKIKPYNYKPQKQKELNAPRTSAKAPQTMCKNLTLSDWLNVVDYHDTHQPISQNENFQNGQREPLFSHNPAFPATYHKRVTRKIKQS